jgi:BlaI family penicillinase repressor
MTKPTKIPPSEWEIMEILWNESPLSAAEVFERMPSDTSWTVKTVRAFLDRLLQREAVSRRKIHGMYVFEPVVRRTDCLRLESKSFLDRFFQGNPISMIAHFLEDERLDEEDVRRLQNLLENNAPHPNSLPQGERTDR